MPATQTFRRKGDLLIAELARRRGEPKEFAGLLALGDGRGLEFTAAPGDVPEGGLVVGGLGATGDTAARCSARSPAASCST